MTFWTDAKVTDCFTPEDKYFYLYLFTNPHTNLCGCYEISLKQISNEMGYSKDSIENLITRFEKVHGVIRFSKETNEILLLNWSKYNWTNSEKFRKPLIKEIDSIKCEQFKNYLKKILIGDCGYGIDTTYIDTTSIDTTVTVSVTDTVSDTVSFSDTDINNTEIYKNVINYLNSICATNYKYSTPKTQKQISARLKEGFTEKDFYTVIDKKSKEWFGTDMEKYLRPETLFGTKFESYLNQKETISKDKGGIDWDNV